MEDLTLTELFKTALNMFSIAMKNEPESQGISILIMHPGWVETDMGGLHMLHLVSRRGKRERHYAKNRGTKPWI